MKCPYDHNQDGDCHICVPGPCRMQKMNAKIDEVRVDMEANKVYVGDFSAIEAAVLIAAAKASPAAIKASEVQGQVDLVESQQLPVKMPHKDRLYLESRGVVFKKKNKDDSLFLDVELPAGWTKKATSHSMWSDLLDDKGVKVASMFYKAAFYDRDAFLDVVYPKETP